MSGRMIFAPTAEMFLWNAGGGVPYKSASERKQTILNVQGKRVYERLVTALPFAQRPLPLAQRLKVILR